MTRTSQRLRRLVQSSLVSAKALDSYRAELLRATREYGASTATLNLFNGPQSAELLRLSILSPEVRTYQADRYGVSCLQVALEAFDTPLPVLGLPIPLSDAMTQRAQGLTKALVDYVNETLALRALEAAIARMRRDIRVAGQKERYARGEVLARRVAAEHNLETQRFAVIHRNENTDIGAR